MAIRKVGDCRILGPLGKGGMAVVYRAIHESLQREVALKELPKDRAANQESFARFKREAMAMAQFRHQHIVTLYDFIEKNDSHYMVMELVDGPTLHDLVREGAFPPEVVAAIGLQLLLALEHAHFHKVVHRDLKPQNVMLSSWGDTKLMDFGISQNEDLARLTQTGMAVGTPNYMSPEQVGGETVDARSDVYSLGIVLYELLSGKRPYAGAEAGEVFSKVVLGKREPLRKVAPKAPRRLVSVIERCIRVKRSQRFADATAARKAFEDLLSQVEQSPSAILVNFLRSRKRLTESEAMQRLSRDDLESLSQLSPVELASVRGPRWKRTLLAGTVVGLTVASYDKWAPLLSAWIRTLK
jgi:eukaryotic-like serine/threonine-protein kinase